MYKYSLSLYFKFTFEIQSIKCILRFFDKFMKSQFYLLMLIQLKGVPYFNLLPFKELLKKYFTVP